jgi:UDP-N-acetylmuramyl pentapeptide phosphotransferase/UDP-N-acetylglucosamine-1-phosphate transferase
MLTFFYIIISVLLIYFINYFFIKKNFLIDKKIFKHKSYTSKDQVPITAGFLILLNFILFNNYHYLLIFFIALFILGIFSDLSLIVSPVKKIILQFLIILSFLYFSNLSILSTKILLLDYLIQNKLFAILFTSFCFLILINGTNFMDGVNTLVGGYYSLVIASVIYAGYQNQQIIYSFFNFYYLLLTLLVILFFNFYSKTYLGDSGSFLLSFVVGCYLVNLCNSNLYLTNFISPLFIVLLLWYPAFENLFSIIRKLRLTKNRPTNPDNLHLHHLLFSILRNKTKKKYHHNSFTGILINLYNFLIFFLGSNFYYHTEFLTFLIFINIFVYIGVYIFLSKKNKFFNGI